MAIQSSMVQRCIPSAVNTVHIWPSPNAIRKKKKTEVTNQIWRQLAAWGKNPVWCLTQQVTSIWLPVQDGSHAHRNTQCYVPRNTQHVSHRNTQHWGYTSGFLNKESSVRTTLSSSQSCFPVSFLTGNFFIHSVWDLCLRKLSGL